MTLLDKFLVAALTILMAILLTRLLPRFRRLALLAILLNVYISARYLWWRGTETLNWNGGLDTMLSLVLIAAELYGFFIVLHHYLIAARPTDRRSEPPDARYSPSVDVMIPTYNEELDILYRTIVGCQEMDYENKKIWVLDDGNRPELAELCRKLGANYIAREDHEGAKAGNLNNALAQTEGELVATFDADHVPVRTFLAETVGFFRDEKIAHVQTPQHFYNNDLFQDRLHIFEYIANEQDMFYHVVLPGRDRYNSAFYCGSNALLRRSAIDDIGGFPTATVTEDLHTSVLMHSRGWKSVFVNRDLAAGLAPESYGGYLTQRLRWAKGTFQVILSENTMFRRGLSFMQRLNYLSTLAYWLYGFPRVVFLTAPLFLLLAGIHPLIIETLDDMLLYYIPHLAVSIVSFQIVNQGLRRVFWSDVYESCVSVQLALASVIFPLTIKRKLSFKVTPKGRDAGRTARARVAWPLWLFLVLMIAGMISGAATLMTGRESGSATLICMIWTAYNLVVVVMGLLLLRIPEQRRESIRIRRQLPCFLRWHQNAVEARTIDISETGLSLRLGSTIVLPEEVHATVTGGDGRQIHILGRPVRCDVNRQGELSAALEFVERTEEQHRRLIEILFSDPKAWSGPHALTMGAPEHLMRFIRSMIAVFSPRSVLRRLAPRLYGELPVRIEMTGGAAVSALTENLSVVGAALRLQGGDTVPEQSRLRMTINWNGIEMTTVDAEVCSSRSSPSGEQVIGVRYVNLSREQSADLTKQLHEGLSTLQISREAIT